MKPVKKIKFIYYKIILTILEKIETPIIYAYFFLINPFNFLLLFIFIFDLIRNFLNFSRYLLEITINYVENINDIVSEPIVNFLCFLDRKKEKIISDCENINKN